jgi:cob(I)alamin adenosyltransferase
MLSNPMPKFKHDEFAKSYLKELLSSIGKAVPNRQIKSETRAADLWFELGARTKLGGHELGLLGDLLTRNSLIEVFRNPASAAEIRSCQGKLFDLEAELLRKTKRRKTPLSEEKLPYLWLIMPTASEEIRNGFGAMPTSTPGVYEFPVLQRTGLIVVHQLPKTEATLWLRILGREGNQRQAIEEFTQQSTENRLRASIEEVLTDYRAKLEDSGEKLTQEDEELIMNLSAAYMKRQQEWLEEGEQRGSDRKVREVAINALRKGFTAELIMDITGLSLEEIEQLRKKMNGL